MTEKFDKHCDHECVCPDFKAANSDWMEDPDPCDLSCMDRRVTDGICTCDLPDTKCKEVEVKERTRTQPLIDAMQEFIDRCDRGEVYSKYTYGKFKQVLQEYKND